MVVRESDHQQQLLMAATAAAHATVIRSRINTYRAVLVDARWSQAIHSCGTATGTAGGGGEGCSLGQRCQAVHYGHCSAVKFTPLQQSGRLNGPRGRAVRIVTKVMFIKRV